MNQDRIVITGLGVRSNIGIGHEAYWRGAQAGESGIGPIDLFDIDDLPCRRAGEVKDFRAENYLPKKGLKYLGRGIAISLVATNLALEDAGIDPVCVDTGRLGVVLGTNCSCVANMQLFDDKAMTVFPDPVFFPNTGISAPACQISIQKGFHCYTSTYTSGLSGGLEAISSAARELRLGQADCVLAGGVEELAEVVFRGAVEMGALQQDDAPWYGPFHSQTSGQIPGEGCAVLVLEREQTARARGAKILAEVGGFATGFDPGPMLGRDPDPAISVRIIREALARSGVTPDGVDYVSSGAFGQPAADRGEAAALCEVFGERKIPIGTPSTQLGNTSGAAGAFQAVTTVLAFRHQALPAGRIDGPNGNMSLDLVGESRPGHVDVGLLTTFGEHGDRAALILKNYSMEEKS